MVGTAQRCQDFSPASLAKGQRRDGAGRSSLGTGMDRKGPELVGDGRSSSLVLSLLPVLLMAFRGNHLHEAIFCCSEIKARPGVSPSLDNEDESQPGLPRKSVN